MCIGASTCITVNVGVFTARSWVCYNKSALYLVAPKHPMWILHLLEYMMYYLENAQWLVVHITTMQHLELGGKRNFFINHLGPRLNKPINDVELPAILVHMVPYHWTSLTALVQVKWLSPIGRSSQISLSNLKPAKI